LVVQQTQSILYESSRHESLVIHPKQPIKPMFLWAKAFIRATKHSIPFFIYAILASDKTTTTLTISDWNLEFQDVFEKKNAYLFIITLLVYMIVPSIYKVSNHHFGLIYNLLQNKHVALKDYIEENFVKNFILHLKFVANVPILFKKKKRDHSIYVLTIEPLIFNKLRVKNCYSLPLISGLFNHLGEAKMYTKINLWRANNWVLI